MFISEFLKKENNNLDILRLLAAFGVIIGHAYSISPQPPLVDGVRSLLKFDYSGSLAVKFFFLLSGLLVCNSLIERRQLLPFLFARSFRLFPGLVVCVLLTVFAFGCLLSSDGLVSYLHNPVTYSYIYKNITLQLQWDLPGLFKANPSYVVNGSLWTLPVEFFCYLTLGSVGAIGLLKNKFSGTLVFIFIASIFVYRSEVIQYFSLPLEAALFPFYFFIGCVLAICKNVIEIDFQTIMGLGLTSLLLQATPLYPVVMCLFIFFTAFYLVSLPILKNCRLPGDFSYGVYLYGFPCQQMAKSLWPEQGVHWNQFFGITTALCFAVLSWYFVEAPAIRLGRQLQKRNF